MSTATHAGNVNTGHEPTEQEQEILDIFRENYITGPSHIRDETGMRRQRVHQLLDTLKSAGWVTRFAHGQYRIEYDGEGYVTHTVHYYEPGNEGKSLEQIMDEEGLTKDDLIGLGSGE